MALAHTALSALILGSLSLVVPPAAALADERIAADEAAVRELERQCEQARAAKLEPLRDAEIARCISQQGRDPQYCERYWRDYGNAARLPNGAIRPRLFDDLPQCVRAHAARRKYNLKGK